MTHHVTGRPQDVDAIPYYLSLLADESVTGAIQGLLNALFVWSRTCHHLRLDSLEVARVTNIPAVLHRAARQEVYDGLKAIDYAPREERWSYRKPPPPNAAHHEWLIHQIADYAMTLTFEEAVAWFIRLMSQWMKKCSVESILENEQTTREPISPMPTEAELIQRVRARSTSLSPIMRRWMPPIDKKIKSRPTRLAGDSAALAVLAARSA